MLDGDKMAMVIIPISDGVEGLTENLAALYEKDYERFELFSSMLSEDMHGEALAEAMQRFCEEKRGTIDDFINSIIDPPTIH
jgi:hypothetical protein